MFYFCLDSCFTAAQRPRQFAERLPYSRRVEERRLQLVGSGLDPWRLELLRNKALVIDGSSLEPVAAVGILSSSASYERVSVMFIGLRC